MGFRFRKTKSSGPFRWTLSKRGISTSVGGKGFRIGVGANGKIRMRSSIPGTGISFSHTFGGIKIKRRKKRRRSSTSSSGAGAAAGITIVKLIGLVAFITIILGFLTLVGGELILAFESHPVIMSILLALIIGIIVVVNLFELDRPNKKPKYADNDNPNEWICPECGRVNQQKDPMCKDCGKYK